MLLLLRKSPSKKVHLHYTFWPKNWNSFETYKIVKWIPSKRVDLEDVSYIIHTESEINYKRASEILYPYELITLLHLHAHLSVILLSCPVFSDALVSYSLPQSFQRFIVGINPILFSYRSTLFISLLEHFTYILLWNYLPWNVWGTHSISVE